jgi:hypothetical protein
VIVVADTTPLLYLSRIRHLDIARALYVDVPVRLVRRALNGNMRSPMNWQNPYARRVLVHGNQGTRDERRRLLGKNSDDEAADGLGEDVLRADLKNAGPPRARQCEQSPEVQVVRDNDVSVLSSVAQQLFVGCTRIPDGGPMQGVNSIRGKDLCPSGC